MVKVDEFESIFRAAEKEPFLFQPPSLSRITLLTDRDHDAASETVAAVGNLLPAFGAAEWSVFTVEDGTAIGNAIEQITASQPDLIVTFRHIGEASLFPEGAAQPVPQHSLGVYLDVLTQVLPQPVLVLPGTAADRVPLASTIDSVMVVTDHIRGQHRLVSAAAAIAPPRSTLWLCHVEDDATFERYLDAIAQIPELDTKHARERIGGVLTTEAHDYLKAAKSGLEAAGLELTIVPHLSQGHRVRSFLDLISTHEVDLVVVNTKDDDQLAMHGTAYALAVELIQTPLLLL